MADMKKVYNNLIIINLYCTNRDNSPQDLYKLTLTRATAKIYEAETNMFAMAPYPHISSRCLSIGHLDWEKV